MKIHKMRDYLKYMSLESKRKLFNSHIMSTFRYGIAQYAGETIHTKSRLHNSIMRCMRVFRGYNRTKNSNNDVLTDMKIEDPRQIVLKDAVKYVHRIVHSCQPSSIFNLLRKPTWRQEGDITMRHSPLTTKTKRNVNLWCQAV